MQDMLSLKVYHGTSIDNGINILKWRSYLISDKDTEWLGKGAYFFINDNNIYSDAIENSKKWALNIKKFRDYCVIENMINVQEEKYMDLDNKDWKRFFHDTRSVIVKSIINRGMDIISSKGKLECFVIDEISDKFEIGAVSKEKYVNFEGVYKGKGIPSSFIPNCKMICIKNLEVIEKDSIMKVKEGNTYGCNENA